MARCRSLQLLQNIFAVDSVVRYLITLKTQETENQFPHRNPVRPTWIENRPCRSSSAHRESRDDGIVPNNFTPGNDGYNEFVPSLRRQRYPSGTNRYFKSVHADYIVNSRVTPPLPLPPPRPGHPKKSKSPFATYCF